MILHREGEVGRRTGRCRLRELLEGMRGVQLVQHMPVDVDEMRPIGRGGHQVASQIFVEQRLRHCGGFLGVRSLPHPLQQEPGQEAAIATT